MKNNILTKVLLLISCILLVSVVPTYGASSNWALILPTDNAKAITKSTDSENVAVTVIGEKTIIQGGATLIDNWHKSPGNGQALQITENNKLWLITTKNPEIMKREFDGFKVIFRYKGFVLIHGSEMSAMGLANLASDFTRIEELPKSVTLRTLPIKTRIKTRAGDPIPEMLKKFDKELFWKDLLYFEACKTRYTYAKPLNQAISYSEKAFEKLNLPVKRQSFTSSGETKENLEAIMQGSDPEAGEVLILGHLDSTSQSPRTLAPGADDNGTGAAGVIAIARWMVKCKIQPKATIRFLLVVGEEQGLLGSKAYVKSLSNDELKAFKAVLNLDMIGFDVKPPLSVLIETYPFCKPLAETMAHIAGTYTKLEPTISYNAWGSDHIPFLKKNVPCTLSIEDEFEANHNYHKTTDTSNFINREQCHEIIKLNAVTAIKYAGWTSLK